ncbi:hypothetical protein [Burkholderia territorii]|uniref:hypothetical protein n=1 Tax=Burkholderia territorii TaxID=1503055 RepID=UPI0012DA548F|nr:hypothetical protein [Burkholderia territorii]
MDAKDAGCRQVQMSGGNRNEWRYYPEGVVARFVGRIAQIDFMRIDFYDEIILRRPNSAQEQVDKRERFIRICLPGAALIADHRSTSRIIGHYDSIAGLGDTGWRAQTTDVQKIAVRGEEDCSRTGVLRTNDIGVRSLRVAGDCGE